jgi:hypothetical protein
MNYKSLFVIKFIFIEIQVKSSEIQWIVLPHIYVLYYIQCYLMLNYWMIVYIKHHAIVTNLYWFKTPSFSVSFDCYVNIDIEEEKEIDFLIFFTHFLFTAMSATLSEHAFCTIIERKNNNKKIFPIFNQTISYKWTVISIRCANINRVNK